jgi:hypothetical protein
MKTETTQPVIMFYGGGWPTNIGNAVIGLGAIALLQAAAPSARVINLSGMPRWLFGKEHAHKALDVAGICGCDLAVFAGMSHCEEFVGVNGPTILKLRERGVPVLLLGTGARLYTAEEKKMYSAFLKQVQPVAVIARDHETYEAYADTVERMVAGIDCGFFVSMAYEPVAVDLPPFVVANFDAGETPKIDTSGREIIYTHHDCWGPIVEERKTKSNTLISDLPYDYLTLYSNAECVYSDRVHACVAALSYGRKAQLFHPTPRGGLFAAMGAGDIREKPVRLDPELFQAKRAEQIRVTSAIIREALAQKPSQAAQVALPARA